MKLSPEAKRIVKKDSIDTVAYIYTDGIVINTKDKHVYKGEVFSKEKSVKIPGEVKIQYRNGKEFDSFVGRIVCHEPSLLLDGIEKIEIYINNSSEKMKELKLTCNTVTLRTESGMKIGFDQFDFISSDFTIQDGIKRSINDWDL